jgi:glycosyltransferase involved in cell wall biosynthesis
MPEAQTVQRPPKIGSDFVIIGNDWNAGIDNPTSKHRIAIELAKRGSGVLWMDGAGMRAPALGSASDRKRLLRKLKLLIRKPRAAAESAHLKGKIWVLTPPLLPLPQIRWIRGLNGLLYRITGAFWARRLGLKSPTLINYVPVLAETMRYWPGRRVYHCVDRWDAFGTYNSELMTEMDARCCRYAEVVIASSRDLAERCARHNSHVELVMHGVDYEHFAHAIDMAARPADLPEGRVVGFFGLLSEWVDQELLVKVARRIPSCQVVLIGKADTNIEALKGIPNIHILGPRPFRELPKYRGHFDVGVIPFRINDLTRAVNPIKLREMLAGGCPVVSTALPEVERYRGISAAVDIAYTDDEFVGHIQKRLNAAATAGERRETSSSMRAETWTAKVDEMLAALKAASA